MSLYDFANGDPVNQFDADGRFGKGVINWLSSDEFNNNSGGVAFAGLAMVLSLDFSTPDPTDVLPQKWGAYAVSVFGTVATAATLSQWEYIFNQTNGDDSTADDNTKDDKKESDGKIEETPKTHPEKFENVKNSKGKRHKETGEIWEKDMMHKDHYEVYKNKKMQEKGKRDRSVWEDGRPKETFK